MYIGHYLPALAAKKAEKSVPLWIYFLASQFLDILWAILIILGIEKVRISPGGTASNPLDLYYIPYTHSLPAAVAWSGAAWIFFRAIKKSGREAAFIAMVVFSHWALDLLSHRPDLPLWGDAFKIGLGLFNFPMAAWATEISFFLIGIFLYAQSTAPVSKIGAYGLAAFALLMVLIQTGIRFSSGTPSARQLGLSALLLYLIPTAIVYGIERKRIPAAVRRSRE